MSRLLSPPRLPSPRPRFARRAPNVPGARPALGRWSALTVSAAAALGVALGVGSGVAPAQGALDGLATAATAPPHAADITLRGRLNRAMATVGRSSGAYVYDLSAKRPLYGLRSTVTRSPASVEKLYTTSTALTRFGLNATLDTTVLGAGKLDDAGVYQGDLYLRGGGDPTYGSYAVSHPQYGTGATVGQLSDALALATGITAVHGSVLGDESLFDSRRGGPTTHFAPDVEIGELSGLAFDRGAVSERGLGSAPDPASFAALALAGQLRSSDIPVSGVSRRGVTPTATPVQASVASPPMRTLVMLTNRPSDNFFAETLLKDLGARFGGQGSTAAGAAVVRRQLTHYGLYPRVHDGSGLDRADHTSPRDVVALFRALQGSEVGGALVDSLAVAGRSGTLEHRLRGTAAQGRCRAKTGSLIDVSALAGICAGADGHELAFAFLMNRVSVDSARAAQDAMAQALVAYRG